MSDLDKQAWPEETAPTAIAEDAPAAKQIEPRKRTSLERRGAEITHDRAKEAAGRLIHSHFGQKPHARISIPLDLDDDDIVIMDYIQQQLMKDLGLE